MPERSIGRQKALAFAKRAYDVAPSHMSRWVEILSGSHQDHVDYLLTTNRFFSLPLQEQAWWDQLIQSAPFAPVLKPQHLRNPESESQPLTKEGNSQMTIEQFDHICRAAAVADVKKIYVFGANAIVPWLLNTGERILLSGFQPSRELDVSTGDEKLDTLIDGAIGEFSLFDETFSVYAHGTSLTGFHTPPHWQKRALQYTESVSGTEVIVPHPHELIISKLVSGRPKDFDFAVSVAKIFPLSDAELKQLLKTFRTTYPEEIDRLQKNIDIWKSRL